MKLEFRQIRCPVCFSHFVTASSKRRVFCSAKCRRRYRRLIWRARHFSDPAKKAASLAKLQAWKEARRREKQPKEGWLEITII
jgi:hypothetical protein